MQNKCICFCSDLIEHIGQEFEKMNWLNTSDRFLQCLCASVFNYFQGKCPEYMNEIFLVADHSNMTTRSSYLKLVHLFRKINMGQNNSSFLGPKEWNKLPMELKLCNTINTFKHKLKSMFLNFKKLVVTRIFSEKMKYISFCVTSFSIFLIFISFFYRGDKMYQFLGLFYFFLSYYFISCRIIR